MTDARRALERAAADGIAPPDTVVAEGPDAALRGLLALIAATMLPRRLALSRADGRRLVMEVAAGRLCVLDDGPPLDAADPAAPDSAAPVLRAFCTAHAAFSVTRAPMATPTRPGLDPAALTAALDLPDVDPSEASSLALPAGTVCAALLDGEEAQILAGDAAAFDALWSLAECRAPGFLSDPAALRAVTTEGGALLLGDAPALLLRAVGAALLIASVDAGGDVRACAGQPD